jgi:hypothetical protein
MSPVHRDTPQIVPFSWPERLPVPAAESNVSQNAGVPPSCILHALADGVGVGSGMGVDPVPEADAEQLKLVPPLEPPQVHVTDQNLLRSRKCRLSKGWSRVQTISSWHSPIRTRR